MSLVYEESPARPMSYNGLYGIRLSGSVPTALKLPVSFRREGEIQSFIEQVKRVSSFKVESDNEGLYLMARPSDSLDSKTMKRYVGDKKKEGKCISFGTPKGKLVPKGPVLFSALPYEKVLIELDTIIRNTVIGDKLKEYWMGAFGATAEGAKRILEEITPLARK